MNKKLPEKLETLIDYYSGDASWEEFSNGFDVDDSSVKSLVTKFNIEQSTAVVIEWHIREQYAEQWFNKKTPALYDLRPIDVLKQYDNGEICLRVILRRMH